MNLESFLSKKKIEIEITLGEYELIVLEAMLNDLEPEEYCRARFRERTFSENRKKFIRNIKDHFVLIIERFGEGRLKEVADLFCDYFDCVKFSDLEFNLIAYSINGTDISLILERLADFISEFKVKKPVISPYLFANICNGFIHLAATEE
jgi:hypothetical protein